MRLVHPGHSLTGLGHLCHGARRARGHLVPVGTSVHLSRVWDGASSAWLSHSSPSWDFLSHSEMGQCPRGLPKQSPAGGSPHLGSPHAAFLSASSGHGPTSRDTHSLPPSCWTLLPAREGRGGQGKAGQGRRGDRRSWGTVLGTERVHASFCLAGILACPGQSPKDPPSPKLEDRSLFSQNMAKMGQ